MNDFDIKYKNILIQIMDYGYNDLNKRTSTNVKALPGIQFRTELNIHGFPLLALRKMPFSFIPEIMWMLSAKKDIKWLKQHTKIWNYFADKNDIVSSAYGYRWKYHFDVDQLNEVIDKLKKNKSDRHGVIMMWDPKTDLTIKQKNVPCPVMFTLNIMENKLCLHLIIRSNDMILGNPTDIAGFAFLNYIIAQELKVQVGTITTSISNAHIYENQYDVAKKLILRKPEFSFINFNIPENCLKRCRELDNSLLKEVKDGFIGYKPLEVIKKIPIAI